MATESKYLFGPVPSRRLGLSLGVDIVPLKTCSQNCLYCQLGVHGRQTVERGEYVKAADVLSELKQRIAEGLQADYITFSGSGEPTLNTALGEMIDGVREVTDVGVAVITNGTLLWDADVRRDCCKADVVLPSLDAGDAETFARINRPHKDLDFETFVGGLCRFRDEYDGQIWLEVFLVEGVNTSQEQVAKMRDLIGRIRPDRIQLNTAVRPTVESGIVRIDEARMLEIAAMIGQGAEVVADFSRVRDSGPVDVSIDVVLDMLKRRPCSIDDICGGLGIDRDLAEKHIARLEEEGKIASRTKKGEKFFSA